MFLNDMLVTLILNGVIEYAKSRSCGMASCESYKKTMAQP